MGRKKINNSDPSLKMKQMLLTSDLSLQRDKSGDSILKRTMKQMTLSSNLSLIPQSKKVKATDENQPPPAKKPRGRPPKNMTVSPQAPAEKNSPNKTKLRSPEKISKVKGRPKPQSKASAKVKKHIEMDGLSCDEDDCDLQENNNNNNNNNKKKSPLNNIFNNNNNNNELLGIENAEEEIDVVLKSKLVAKTLNKEDAGSEEVNTEVPTEPNAISSTSPLVDKSSTKKKSSAKGQNKSGEKPSSGFTCKVCHEWFPNRYFQRKHMLMDHEDQLYECRVCAFNSVDPEKLKNHIIKLHVIKREKAGNIINHESLQGELEKLIDKKVPRKVMMEDGVTLGRDTNSKMRYVCALCHRIYTSKYSLERHVRCHTLEKPYNCDVCNFSSSYREHMMRHITSVHLIVHSDAPKKKINYKKKQEVADNLGEVSPGKKRRNILRERFECAVCGLKATHKSDLMNHIRNKHPNAHIESLVNNDGSKVHLIVTNAKKVKPTKKLTIQCQHCSLIFHDTWKYKVHLRSHTGVKPFECSICDLRATSKMTVRDHIHRKHKEADNAKIVLRTVGIGGEVEKVELPVPWREFKCEYCGEQCNDNYNLKLHKSKAHPDELPFLCLTCNHKEKTKANMIIHCTEKHPNEDIDSIVMHNGKPIKIGQMKLPTCDICHKLFPYKSLLNLHTRLHTGEKELSCYHCDYQTNTKNLLALHLQKKHFDRASPIKKAPKKKKTSKTAVAKADSE